MSGLTVWMAGLFCSVMSNECSTMVAVLTTVLHAVGMYARHWNLVYESHHHHDGRKIGHEGLWRTCTRNETTAFYECVEIQHVSAWLLTVQILVAVSFGGTLIAAVLKMIYHFRLCCNYNALAQSFILLGILSGFLLLVAVCIYAASYRDRGTEFENKHRHAKHHNHIVLSWTFKVEVVATVFTIAAALMALCEKTPPRSSYTEI